MGEPFDATQLPGRLRNAVVLTPASPLTEKHKLKASQACANVVMGLESYGYKVGWNDGLFEVSTVKDTRRPADAPAILTLDTFMGAQTRKRDTYGFKRKAASSLTFTKATQSMGDQSPSAAATQPAAATAVAAAPAPRTPPQQPPTPPRFQRLTHSLDTLNNLQIPVAQNINHRNLLNLASGSDTMTGQVPRLRTPLARPSTAPAPSHTSPTLPPATSPHVSDQPSFSGHGQDDGMCQQQTQDVSAALRSQTPNGGAPRPHTPVLRPATAGSAVLRPHTPQAPQTPDTAERVGAAGSAAASRPATPVVDLHRDASAALRPQTPGTPPLSRPYTARPSSSQGFNVKTFKPSRGHALVVFQHMDKDRNGKVTLSEMEDACLALGFSTDQALKFFNRLDKGGKGYLSASDWGDVDMRGTIQLFTLAYMQWFMGLPSLTTSPEQIKMYVRHEEAKAARSMGTALQMARANAVLRGAHASTSSGNVIFEAFRFMDSNGSGTLSYEELRDGFYALGVCVKDDVMRQMMAYMDANNDGSINYYEFVKRMFPAQRHMA